MKSGRLFPIAFVLLTTSATFGGDTLLDTLPTQGERVWIGPEFWANRLQDWRVRDGRLECVEARAQRPMRTVHLLTHRLVMGGGAFSLRVRTGAIDPEESGATGAGAGFLLGAGGREQDYRAAALVHHSHGPGGGVFCGVDRAGQVFVRPFDRAPDRAGSAEAAGAAREEIVLELDGRAKGNGNYQLTLRAKDTAGGVISELETDVRAWNLLGGLALVSHPGRREQGRGERFWFRQWEVDGRKILVHPERAIGPILSTQYTLSQDVLKLTAQLLPIGEYQSHTARLEIERAGGWQTIAWAPVVVPGWTATFRVADWDSSRPLTVRIAYEGSYFLGTIRRDPVDRQTIVVAGFTGNHNCQRGVERPNFPWRTGVWFPHADIVASVQKHSPDLLFFSGDQVYEGGSPTGVDRPNLDLDYLYKWYLWCWAFRDLTREIPCVTIPDDHDVYQGNLWGENGRATDKDDKGGYVYPAPFVRMVERTQTGHLPDPYDPTPIEQGIGVYYAPLVWGRISFAVLEDRKFKTGCNGRVPPSGSPRADHINDPEFDVARADVAGAKLLGDRQLGFLAHWATDWSGADMKVALSQTVFAGLATHHGPGLAYLRADLDSNGWPQSGRRRALHELRRGFAFHLAGDQHLATLVQHGIDEWEDAGWSFAVPSIANFYPRMWKPKQPGENRAAGAPEFTGRHYDGLGNRITMHAATNPDVKTGREPAALHDKMPGYGILKLDKDARTITVECWPRWADPRNPAHRQYAGWPRTISQRDCYGRQPSHFLPELNFRAMDDPVVQVEEESTGEVVYTVRIRGRRFRPGVFAAGNYLLRVGEPYSEKRREIPTIRAVARGQDSGQLDIDL